MLLWFSAPWITAAGDERIVLERSAMQFKDRDFRGWNKKEQHAPVNPMTGAPGGWGSQTAGPTPAEGMGRATEAAIVDGRPEGETVDGRSGVRVVPSSALLSEPVQESGYSNEWNGFPTWDAKASRDETPRDERAFTTSNASMDELLDKLRPVLDSRLLATVVLGLLSFVVVARESILVFFIVFIVGYMLLDRFLTVRRCITLGGSAWFLLVLLGDLLTPGGSPFYISVEYLFMFCGFLLALAVCGVFFAGRAFYYMGFDRGQEVADRAIAKHIVDRLIDNPEHVDNLDGTYLEVEGSISRVRDRERQVNDALRDEARRKDDLVTYLAHDLKTPLASVVGYLSLLEEATDLPAEQRIRFTGIALDKAHRLDALIEEFFDITRFDFHDIVLTRGYVDLSLLLAQVADEFYPILSDQGKSVEVDAPAHLTVLIDGDKMARVFNNVLKNAIAYSYEGSTIRISAVRGQAGVTVRFENQGDPIPAPKLGMIFEKFYRLDASRATNRGGAGLGLAIAKEIVAAHGGTIACTSDPEHTVFTIELPEK